MNETAKSVVVNFVVKPVAVYTAFRLGSKVANNVRTRRTRIQ